MTYPVKSYAAFSATTDLEPHSFERRELREDDVLIDILYCGVCHSDLHTARNDWGWTHTYPIVPGHEIIGRVTKVGSKANKFQIGDLVGVGCMVDSCRTCSPCQKGLEQYCENGNTGTYGSHDRFDGTLTQGGYSTGVVVSEDFVLKVSEKLDTKAVAPLLCGRHYHLLATPPLECAKRLKSRCNWLGWSWAYGSKISCCDGSGSYFIYSFGRQI
ncbi:alcohol dehydrogenase catalytic domain-containing protein [Mannheimia varigena]|uniref:alcohol dehydrogenase catalytic domain-containing protein n=1 Tax=Mannheimia varigena TaxID=85404 RepID=UPI0004B7B709|nr:alcohol dehydrogenase catalytic domain-containing protein [Mannheimia varigena]